MRWLIVNADDLGMGPGVNRGILEAHQDGIVTSASLLVDGPWSLEAARLCRDLSGLSVGLHARIGAFGAGRSSGAMARCRAELSRQFSRFKELTGRAPTHLDSHFDVHRDPALAGVFLEIADWWGVPLRGHSPVQHLPRPAGASNGVDHVEPIDVAGLERMLDSEVHEGVTELICHPAHPDPAVPPASTEARAVTLRALCDPRIRRALWTCGIRLASYHDLARLGVVREMAWHA
jgi:predicted glycoside hydrolase/deacetylase ChbG (UPF0249 family)